MKKRTKIICGVVLCIFLFMFGLVMLGRHHPLSEGNLVGTYEMQAKEGATKMIILQREGVVEEHDSSMITVGEWEVKNREIHVKAMDYGIYEVIDGNLKLVARKGIFSGSNSQVPIEEQKTFIKIAGEEKE